MCIHTAVSRLHRNVCRYVGFEPPPSNLHGSSLMLTGFRVMTTVWSARAQLRTRLVGSVSFKFICFMILTRTTGFLIMMTVWSAQAELSIGSNLTLKKKAHTDTMASGRFDFKAWLRHRITVFWTLNNKIKDICILLSCSNEKSEINKNTLLLISPPRARS